VSEEEKHLDKVRRSFDAAEDYDEKMSRTCPSHQPLLDAIMRCAKVAAGPARILELGVGTGLLAQELLRAFPKARLVAIDFSPNMIERATKRLSRLKARVELVQGDFYEQAFPSGQALVVSSYAIHHLSDVQKATLFEKVYDCLAEDGVFINGDCVVSRSDRLNELQNQCWLDAMHQREASQQEIDQTIRDYYEYDIPATVDDQLGWLERAGFSEAECMWRNFGSAVIVAIK